MGLKVTSILLKVVAIMNKIYSVSQIKLTPLVIQSNIVYNKTNVLIYKAGQGSATGTLHIVWSDESSLLNWLVSENDNCSSTINKWIQWIIDIIHSVVFCLLA